MDISGEPDNGHAGTGSRAAPAGLILAVVVASAVVAVGASGVGLLLPPAELSVGWLRAVRVAGAVVSAAGVAALLNQRKRLRSNEGRAHDPAVVALVAAATIMAALAMLALLARTANVVSDPDGEDRFATEEVRTEGASAGPGSAMGGDGFGLGAGRASPGGEISQRIGGESLDGAAGGFGWSMLRRAGRVLLLVLFCAVVVFGILAVMGRLGQRRHSPHLEVPVAAAAAEAGLQASLVEVADEGQDPRRQIIGAYYRLLAGLAAAGAPRQPQEAPHEYLRRTLGPLGVHPEPMHRLTRLYVEAQFSERPMTDRHRAAAAAALEAGLLSLRATQGAPDADRAGTIPAEANA